MSPSRSQLFRLPCQITKTKAFNSLFPFDNKCEPRFETTRRPPDASEITRYLIGKIPLTPVRIMKFSVISFFAQTGSLLARTAGCACAQRKCWYLDYSGRFFHLVHCLRTFDRLIGWNLASITTSRRLSAKFHPNGAGVGTPGAGPQNCIFYDISGYKCPTSSARLTATPSTTFTQCAPEATEFGESWNNALRRSRSPILVPIESSRTTSY